MLRQRRLLNLDRGNRFDLVVVVDAELFSGVPKKAFVEFSLDLPDVSVVRIAHLAEPVIQVRQVVNHQ